MTKRGQKHYVGSSSGAGTGEKHPAEPVPHQQRLARASVWFGKVKFVLYCFPVVVAAAAAAAAAESSRHPALLQLAVFT